MPVINISVENKIAEADGTLYVCDNSDFVAKFAFDAEWEAYENKTARFCYNNSYVDVVFTGNECPVPIISGTYFFNIGVYAGNLRTTTPARVPCKKFILCDTGFPADPPNDVYNQIMEKLNSFESADPEDIAKVVANYLAEHPVEETDPTVPEWAKAETKPTYTADEVGAISKDDLQTATNNALAQAKASGAFDGAPGTPGAKGDTGAPGKDGAGMDITGATVGQIAKITAVDASGVPTAWIPVDMPSGGGGETWELIKVITIADDAAESNALTIDTDESGKSFSLKKAKIFGIFPAYKGESTMPNFSFFMLNGVVSGGNAPYCYTSGWESVAGNVQKSCSVEVDLTMPGLQAETAWRAHKVSGEYFGPAKIESITSIGGHGMLIYPGCKFWLYGVRS